MGIVGSFFGGSCFLCRGAAEDLLCAACLADLPRLPSPACPRCALASPQGAVCGRCLAEPPPYDATVAVFSYAFPVDVLVHALKFRGELALAPYLGKILFARMEAADLVIPVPLSKERLRERGYNQAVEIARATKRKVELDLCVRRRHTAQQFDLPWSERRRNVHGAFACSRRIEGRSVAVVDDVMTTGATLAEIATTLKAAGAARVSNWVLARTPPPDG